MFRIALIAFALMFTFSAPTFAQKKSSGSGGKVDGPMFIDVILLPKVAGGVGSFEKGDIDAGKYANTIINVGGLLKIGPLVGGGEFTQNQVYAFSNEVRSFTVRNTSPSLNESLGTELGVSMGLITNRILLLYTVSSSDLKIKNARDVAAMEDFDFSYHGSSAKSELLFRVASQAYFGFYYRTQEYDKYTSKRTASPADKADMDPTLKITDYGVVLGGGLPLSSAIKSWFKK